MKIVNPSFEIVRPHAADGIICLQAIERMARISHRAEDKITDDSWKRFIQAVVLDHGDWSVVEHASATVIIRTDRAICMEIVRHRVASYTMESTRFCNYSKKELDFISPLGYNENENDEVWTHWRDSLAQTEQTYLYLLRHGWRPQEARSVLPNCTAATIAITTNLRNLRHFFLMRTSRETHPELRRITIPMLEEFKKRVPLLYDDILPEERQIDNLRKPK
jgi:thymidylate synthase (FAD)